MQAVFKDYAESVIEDSRRADRQLGLSQNSYRELATVIGSQLRNAGIPMDQIAAKTASIVQLGADLAAQFGGSTQEAVQALSATFRGEFDPIERYGISLNAAAIGSEAVALGAAESATELDQNAKVTAALSILTRQSADAQGAFAREADTAAGRAQRAAAQFENLKVQVGDRLLPAFSAGADLLGTTLIPALGAVSDTVADVIGGFVDLPGPVQAGALALGAYALAGDRVIGGLGSLSGSLSPIRGGFQAFGEALEFARAKGDGLGTVLRSVGSYAGGQLLTGLGSLARAIGPELGVAAAVTAIAFMVDGLTSLDESTEEAKSAQQNLASALRETNGVIDENVRQTAAKAAQDSGLLDTAESLGIKLSTVTDAVLGNVGAYDQVIGASEAYLQQQLILAGGDPTDASFQNSADAVRIFRNNLGELVPTVQQTAGDQRQLAAATDQAAESAQAAVDPAAAFKAELEASAEAAEAAKKQTDQFKLSLDILTGATVSAIQVESAFQDALDAAKDATKDLDGAVLNAEGSINLQSEAGRKAADVLLDVRNSGNDLIATLITQGATEDDVRRRDTELRRSFIDTAGQMGITGGNAERLADQILGIPDRRNTTITADVGPAERAVREFVAGVTGKSIALTGDFVPGRGVNVRRAHGGAVFGPGTETSDSIPALLSAGEHVWSAREVRGAGGHQFLEEMRAAARRGALAQFAHGGPVLVDRYAIPVNLTGFPDPSRIGVSDAADVGVPGRGGALGSTFRSLFAAIKSAFPQARLNSGFRPGDPGYHGRGKAADIGLTGVAGGAGNSFMAGVSQWLYDNHRGSLAELIYNGLGDNRPNIKNSRDFAYSPGTQRAHRNHVHAAVYDDGGWLRPGYTLAYNGTGQPERVRTVQQEAALGRSGPLIHVERVESNVDLELFARQVEFRERMGAF